MTQWNDTQRGQNVNDAFEYMRSNYKVLVPLYVASINYSQHRSVYG